MFCPNCGKQIGDTSKFCIKCGHNVEDEIKKVTTPVNTSKNNIKSETGQKSKVIICSDCGKEVEEGSTFCPHCKVLLTQTIQGTYKVYNSYRCPKCGSDRVTQSEIYEQKKRGHGCLLWIIIFILCPLVFLLFFGMVGYSLYQFPIIFIFFIIGIIFYKVYKQNRYICERCGYEFKIEK